MALTGVVISQKVPRGRIPDGSPALAVRLMQPHHGSHVAFQAEQAITVLPVSAGPPSGYLLICQHEYKWRLKFAFAAPGKLPQRRVLKYSSFFQ